MRTHRNLNAVPTPGPYLVGGGRRMSLVARNGKFFTLLEERFYFIIIEKHIYFSFIIFIFSKETRSRSKHFFQKIKNTGLLLKTECLYFK